MSKKTFFYLIIVLLMPLSLRVNAMGTFKIQTNSGKTFDVLNNVIKCFPTMYNMIKDLPPDSDPIQYEQIINDKAFENIIEITKKYSNNIQNFNELNESDKAETKKKIKVDLDKNVKDNETLTEFVNIANYLGINCLQEAAFSVLVNRFKTIKSVDEINKIITSIEKIPEELKFSGYFDDIVHNLYTNLKMKIMKSTDNLNKIITFIEGITNKKIQKKILDKIKSEVSEVYEQACFSCLKNTKEINTILFEDQSHCQIYTTFWSPNSNHLLSIGRYTPGNSGLDGRAPPANIIYLYDIQKKIKTNFFEKSDLSLDQIKNTSSFDYYREYYKTISLYQNSFSPNNKYLVYRYPKKIMIYDITTKETKTINIDTSKFEKNLYWSLDGETIYFPYNNNDEVIIYKIKTHETQTVKFNNLNNNLTVENTLKNISMAKKKL